MKNGTNQKRERRHKAYLLVRISALENAWLLATERPLFRVFQNIKLLHNFFLVFAAIGSLDSRPSVRISEREEWKKKGQNVDATHQQYRTND